MDGKFKETAEALFHLAQIYEVCATTFRDNDLLNDVLLELADKLIDELRKTHPRHAEK